MAKDNVAEFLIKHKVNRYKGEEYDRFEGAFECNGITHIVSFACDGSGTPKIYTAQQGKHEGKQFMYARAVSFRKGKREYTRRNQSKA